MHSLAANLAPLLLNPMYTICYNKLVTQIQQTEKAFFLEFLSINWSLTDPLRLYSFSFLFFSYFVQIDPLGKATNFYSSIWSSIFCEDLRFFPVKEHHHKLDVQCLKDYTQLLSSDYHVEQHAYTHLFMFYFLLKDERIEHRWLYINCLIVKKALMLWFFKQKFFAF